jgi:hypothetical protein
MATLVLAKTFLPDYAKLDKSVATKVVELFAKFREATHTGLHLEKYQGAKDPRARTIRVDQQYRGIVIAPEAGDTYILFRVLKHSEADEWMARNEFGVNDATGALEVTDVVSVEGARAALDTAPAPAVPSLFAGIKPSTLKRLGVPESLAPLLAKITDFEELEGLVQALPEGQASVLESLALGASPDEAWAELMAGQTPAAVDPDDLAAAAARPVSQGAFYVVQGEDELFEMLSRPFELWRTFLHPNQRRLVARNYSGPARVTGGAGTGKTVVAMHRARELATRLVQESPSGTDKVLLTTFTLGLADSLTDTMATFCSPEVNKRIEVINVDRLALHIVQDATTRKPAIIQPETLNQLWEDVADELGTGFSRQFLNQEWRQVVLAQGIQSQADYLKAQRAGRGIQLHRRERMAIWKAIEELTSRLANSGRVTFLQLADLAAAHLQARTVKPYSHVLVDEAQDLHPAQWRMLRAAVAPSDNDMFIVGDTHQRIYDNRVTLSRVGINVVGRSARLRINYRTTAEILNWSLHLLSGESFDDLDEGTESHTGYRSALHGTPPELIGYDTVADEIAGMVEAVKGWIGLGFTPGEIGVGAPTGWSLEKAEAALQAVGIPARMLGVTRSADHVTLSTMHSMKGLEFRAVALMDVTATRIPAHVTQETVDPLQHRYDLQKERCLLHVACTRARDTLRLSWAGKPSPFLS